MPGPLDQTPLIAMSDPQHTPDGWHVTVLAVDAEQSRDVVVTVPHRPLVVRGELVQITNPRTLDNDTVAATAMWPVRRPVEALR
jgi:hypothetical protein